MTDAQFKELMSANVEIRKDIAALKLDFGTHLSIITNKLNIIDNRLSLIEQRLESIEQWVPVDHKDLKYKTETA